MLPATLTPTPTPHPAAAKVRVSLIIYPSQTHIFHMLPLFCLIPHLICLLPRAPNLPFPHIFWSQIISPPSRRHTRSKLRK